MVNVIRVLLAWLFLTQFALRSISWWIHYLITPFQNIISTPTPFPHSHFFFLQMSVANWSSFSEESGNEIVLQLMESIVSRCNEGVFGGFSLQIYHATRLEKYNDERGSIHLLSNKGDWFAAEQGARCCGTELLYRILQIRLSRRFLSLISRLVIWNRCHS